jgi:hypothetical protein
MLAAIRAGRTSDLMRIATAHSQFGLQAVRQLARDVKEPTTAAAGGQP